MNQTDDVKLVDDSAQVQQADQLMIRATNVGDRPLGDVIIHFSSIDTKGQNATKQTEGYGDLFPTEASQYHPIDGSFRYAPMEALVDGDRIRMGVTDFVGEYAIPNGNYTYKLLYGPRAMNGGIEGLDGQLVYDQTALDSAIDKALDEEIAISILEEYYRKAPSALGMDNAVRGSLGVACVHQQTHRGGNLGKSSSVVVYAKVLCKATFPQNSLNERIETFFPLPIRIELQAQNELFSVVSYQFPRKDSDYDRDMEKIFSPSAKDEMAAAEILAAVYNHLALKLMWRSPADAEVYRHD